MKSDSIDVASEATAALITPRGRGAVAVIRICASIDIAGRTIDRHFFAANGLPIAEQPIGTIRFGQWVDTELADDSTRSEDLVVCRTSDTEIEVQCHGGDAAVNRILQHLSADGIATITWQDQRAQLTSPFAAECDAALSHATTVRTAAILLEQTSGLLEQEITSLLDLSHSADDSDSGTELERRLRELVRWGNFGVHLSDQPWRVVLAGRPNAGKSTLLNALLGYARAIVYDQPGTTRDIVTGETAFDGWPVRLTDTAGIRNETNDELEREGIGRTWQAASDADLVCLVLDLSEPETSDGQFLIDRFQSRHQETRQPVLFAGSKSDLRRVWTPDVAGSVIDVCATKGDGVEPLLRQITSQLVPEVPPSRTPLPVTRRQYDWLSAAMYAHANGHLTETQKALQHCLDGTDRQ